ncbi:MAG: histidine kinase [Bacteroidetes bacterium]|nr:histidine kinase [Bacteroidota bacterium]
MKRLFTVLICCFAFYAATAAQNNTAVESNTLTMEFSSLLHYTFQQDVFTVNTPVAAVNNGMQPFRNVLVPGIIILLIFIARTWMVWNWHRNALKQLAAKQIAADKLKVLNTQLNPRFIQQSFAYVSRLIQNHSGNDQAIKAMREISVYLRQAMDISGAITSTLETELEFTELYLRTQCMIMPGLFDYHINVDNETDTIGIDVPAMLLQPVLESCITVMKAAEIQHGHIAISVREQERSLAITVKSLMAATPYSCMPLPDAIKDAKALTTKRLQLTSTGNKRTSHAVTADTLIENGMAGVEWRISIPLPGTGQLH